MIKLSFWFIIKQYKVSIMEMRICEYKRIHDDEISSSYLFFQNITKIYLCHCTKIDNKFAFFTIFKSEAYYHEFLFTRNLVFVFYFFVTINFPNFFRIFSLFLSLFSLIIYVFFIYICFVLIVFTWFRTFLTLSLLFLLSLIIHFLLFFLLSLFSYFFPT